VRFYFLWNPFLPRGPFHLTLDAGFSKSAQPNTPKGGLWYRNCHPPPSPHGTASGRVPREMQRLYTQNPVPLPGGNARPPCLTVVASADVRMCLALFFFLHFPDLQSTIFPFSGEVLVYDLSGVGSPDPRLPRWSPSAVFGAHILCDGVFCSNL